MERVNLIITTYAGMYNKYSNNEHKHNYLKYNLSLLNEIKTNIKQITIMKPHIDPDHQEMVDYYNLDNLNIKNIKDKIKIYNCENIGISYGQYLYCLYNDRDFDYYIFLEDDYIVFKDYFEMDLITELKKHDNSYVCMHTFNHFHYINEFNNMDNSLENKEILKNKLYKYGCESTIVPDFSLGILSNLLTNKIFAVFPRYDDIKSLLEVKTRYLYFYQILFGFILTISNIGIKETSELYMNLYYDSDKKVVRILNKSNTLGIPLFIPLDMLINIQYVNIDNFLSNDNYKLMSNRMQYFVYLLRDVNNII